jgi:hypothetical protein
VEATEEEIAEESTNFDDEIEGVEEDAIDSVDEEVDTSPQPITTTKAKESSSSDDVIRCPDCEQKLKVPYDRRPVRARCPACKCEFRALKG